MIIFRYVKYKNRKIYEFYNRETVNGKNRYVSIQEILRNYTRSNGSVVVHDRSTRGDDITDKVLLPAIAAAAEESKELRDRIIEAYMEMYGNGKEKELQRASITAEEVRRSRPIPRKTNLLPVGNRLLGDGRRPSGEATREQTGKES